MTERKYRYKKPQGSDEHLEAIYEELSLSPAKNDRYRPTETLKDRIDALLDHARRAESRRKDEKEEESSSVDWALGALGVLSLIFLFNGVLGSGNWNWLDNHRFAIRLWGIAFAALFVGLSIERSSFFKSLWTFGFTKLVASVAVSALIVFSTGKASSLINGVFLIDASALPYTRAVVAGLLAFQYSYPLLMVVAVFAVVHALNAVTWIRSRTSENYKYEGPPLQSMLFLGLSLVVLFVLTKWDSADFSDEAWPPKIYRLAHILDFDSKYQCSNIKNGFSVVFLGPDQSRVMVDVGNAQTDNLESFVDGNISSQVAVPQQFYILPCELIKPVPQGG